MEWPVWIAIVVAVVGSLFLWIYRYLTRLYGYWEANGVKTSPPVVFFGSLYEYFKRDAFVIDEERFKKYGRIYGFYEFHLRAISVSEPELIRQILVKDFHIFTNRRKMETKIPLLDNLLTSVRNETWKRIRSVISPSFTSGKMRKMNPFFMEATENLVNNFSASADSTVELKKYMSAFTTDVLGLCAFGIRLDSLKNPDHAYVVNSRKIFNQKPNIFLMILMMLLIMIPGGAKVFGTMMLRKVGMGYFSELSTEIINKRKNKIGKDNVDFMQLMLDAQSGKLEKEVTEDSQPRQHVQLDDSRVLRNIWNISKSLSDDEIQAQSVTFLLAGQETSATSLAFIFYELAMNPDIQERLHTEVTDAYNTHGEFNYDVVNKMVYLDAVVSESLRLHTVGFRIEREAREDYPLGSTGIVIPKDCLVFIPLHTLHHDPELFPEPNKFDPERFSPENRSSIVPYSYLPFSDGPRNCIAMRFALLELKICVCRVLRKIRFVATDETRAPIEYFVNQNLVLPKEIKVKTEMRL